MKHRVKRGSAASYVLEALIPFSDPNLKLVFKPSVFFYELSKISGKAESSLKNALVVAKKQNLVVQDGSRVVLTRQAELLLQQFKKLQVTPLKSGHMLVLFDIPQTHDKQRRLLVRELKELKFKQIQKSVWASDYDHRELILDIIAELKIGPYIAISITHPVFGSHHFE